tara:strand:- start:4595 stop:5341 length:747 start_codon:yes stop_codon:yes gene_type:complete
MGNIVTRATFLIMLLGLQSCDYLWNFFEPEFNIKEKDYVAGIVDGDPEPPYATPQMSKSSLLGIDKDNDGVRDDIEIWINRNVDEAIIRNYLKIYIKRRKLFLTCENENECLKAYRIHRRSTECFRLINSTNWKLEKILKVENLLNQLYFNSSNKQDANSRMSKYLAATSWGSSDDLGLFLLVERFCEFEVKVDQNILENIWNYSNRARFAHNIKRGLYEQNFDLSIDISDYPNLCDGFNGPEQNLCD